MHSRPEDLRSTAALWVAASSVLLSLTFGGFAHAQNLSVYYQEVRRGDAIYVFNTPER